MLILSVPEDFDKLLQYSCVASVAFLREPGRIVVVAIDASLMFVITVLRPKYCWTYRTRKVLDVILAL